SYKSTLIQQGSRRRPDPASRSTSGTRKAVRDVEQLGAVPAAARTQPVDRPQVPGKWYGTSIDSAAPGGGTGRRREARSAAPGGRASRTAGQAGQRGHQGR